MDNELQRRVELVCGEMTDYLIDPDASTVFVDDLIERWQRILLQIDDWDEEPILEEGENE